MSIHSPKGIFGEQYSYYFRLIRSIIDEYHFILERFFESLIIDYAQHCCERRSSLGTVRLSSALLRLIVFLVTTRLGLIIVGAVLVVVGVVYGVNSHEVKYQTVETGVIVHYLSGDVTQNANAYVLLADGPTLYIVPQTSFKPIIDGTNTFSDGDTISLVYRTDNPTSISETANNTGAKLEGSAYTVEKITLFSSTGRQVFVSDDYTQHPHAYYINNWPLGGLALGIGAILAALAFFMPQLLKKRSQQAASGTVAVAMPSAAAGAQFANPYAQPYQSPAQYQQYQQPDISRSSSASSEQSS